MATAKRRSTVNSAIALRWVLGFGCWVQGFRCFPWMAVNFFLKDEVKVDPSTLQLLQNSVNLPMVGKPIYGVLSDAVYISGQHRLPYIALGALMQAISWLLVALLFSSGISIFMICFCLLLGNLGASFVEVANDAIVVEVGKKATYDKENKSTSGELQSFLWMTSSLGGVLGNLLSGVAIVYLNSQTMLIIFALVLVVQLIITMLVHESTLDLPSDASVGIVKQLSKLLTALRNTELAYSVAWFAASYAIVPVLGGSMFFYQTQHLGIDSSVLGISKVFGQGAVLLWSVIYNKHLKSISPRKLISAIQATMAVIMVSDALFVKGFYRNLGVSDSVYVVVFSGVLEVVFFFKILPFSVLIAQLCPPGCEGSLMAFVMSAVSLAMIVSGYLGVFLASCVGVTGNDFSDLPRGLVIQAVFTVVPLFWSAYIPDHVKLTDRRKEE